MCWCGCCCLWCVCALGFHFVPTHTQLNQPVECETEIEKQAYSLVCELNGLLVRAPCAHRAPRFPPDVIYVFWCMNSVWLRNWNETQSFCSFCFCSNLRFVHFVKIAANDSLIQLSLTMIRDEYRVAKYTSHSMAASVSVQFLCALS